MRFDFKDKTVLVVGLGKSGIAAAEALLKQGAKVTVYDRKQEGEMEPTLVQFFKNQKADCCFGEHPADLTRFEFLVMSPGVPLDTPFVAKAAELGAKLAQPGGGALTAFEKACDDAVTAYLSAARRIPFGEQTVVGYLYAKELEFTAIRTIFAGRAAGLDGDTIRARLRETYV